MNETTIVRSILDALTMHGYWAWRANSGSRPTEYKGKVGRIKLSPPGTPDVLVVLPGGQLAGLEAKTAKGRQTETQRRWQTRAERHGVRYAVVRSAVEALAIVKEWTR